ncbi:MAG: aspartate-semialdehyde dehydrogenase [Elusimicrobiota bacterium]|nr:aspartate-semialdehyde dehydrogenase [Elusimicrobiota bacterium]
MKKYHVGVVGIGLVGGEMVKVLKERNFPASSIRVFATRERVEEIAGQKYQVEVVTDEVFKDLDLAFFAGTEGAKGSSQLYGWKAVNLGACVIDNGDDFRMDPRVPLVVPEVNPHHLSKEKKFIANPNCSTIQMVVALAPLHKYFKIKRIVVATYQSVSGTGRQAINELYNQSKEIINSILVPLNPTTLQSYNSTTNVYPHRIAFNLFPQIGSLSEEFKGYYKEEVKMIKETRKIFDQPYMNISATCVRVPVFFGHSEAINVQFEKKVTAKEAKEILSNSVGVKVVDEPERSIYPHPIDVAGKDDVFVGRIREDESQENTLDLWVVADNIRKGAATNAVQIAEELIMRGYL